MGHWTDEMRNWLRTLGRNILRWLRRLVSPLSSPAFPRTEAADPAWSAAFLEEVLHRYHFRPEAAAWLRREVRLEVVDPHSQRGGGFWQPNERLVRLLTAQHEAAVHELAHAWWHYRRRGQERQLIEAVVRAAAEPDQCYSRVQQLAHGYVHGTPHDGWPGLLVDDNDWEMFAGLASGIMGDMRLLPPYLRPFYRGLFQET